MGNKKKGVFEKVNLLNLSVIESIISYLDEVKTQSEDLGKLY